MGMDLDLEEEHEAIALEEESHWRPKRSGFRDDHSRLASIPPKALAHNDVSPVLFPLFNLSFWLFVAILVWFFFFFLLILTVSVSHAHACPINV